MTTLKEYKAMMEGATDAPWVAIYCGQSIYHKNARNKKICGMPSKEGNTFEDRTNLKNAKFIVASRNIAPELIRVIELAEDALVNAQATLRHYRLYDLEKVEKALSEIRKLKGE